MSNEQKIALRQQAANLKGLVAASFPDTKSVQITLNYEGGACSIQVQSNDTTLAGAAEVATLACKIADLPAAE